MKNIDNLKLFKKPTILIKRDIEKKSLLMKMKFRILKINLKVINQNLFN